MMFFLFNMSNRFSENFILKLADGIIVHNQTSFKDLKFKHPNISNLTVIPHGNYLPFVNQISKIHNNFEPLRTFLVKLKKLKD